ncbi:MAG TPA: D-aminoacylase [Firmicutes bacterium]|nr:D-aminoacylase [Candidatus Fermentithermobacillaceae bacterium]
MQSLTLRGKSIMYDLVFRNARILDGTGAPWYRGDVAVKDGRIAKVGVVETKGREEVDCTGNYLCPGFIDAHSHSDQALVTTPTADSKVMQGVTLEVIGQCGASAAPRGMSPDEEDEDGDDTLTPSWTDMGSYLDLLETNGVSVNVAALVGHGSVRRQVMGSLMRAPTTDEMNLMKRLVAQAMDQGAWGISTGLIYVPGVYAGTEEIIELAKAVSSRRGVYFTHMRNEGPNLLEAIEEALRIGREADIPVQISHFKAAGKANWGKVMEGIEMIERARRSGLDVTADQYPYIASSTGLGAFIPSWVWEGGREAALDRMRDPAERRRIIDAIAGRDIWSNLVVANVSSVLDADFVGKSVADIAGILAVSPEEACLGLLERNLGIVQIVNFAMSEDDVKTVMRQPWVMVGSDARALKKETAKGQPHPRSYGTFARILGKYVREEKTLRLEEAVRKMTSLPAMRLGLQDRGLVREGMWADLVLFDADEIADVATYTDPHQYAKGILRVLVNGVAVVKDGKHTGKRPGKVLRH